MKVRLDEVCNIYKGKTTITKAVQGEYPLVVTAEERSSHNEYQFDCKAVCVPLVSATGHGHASIKRIHYQEGKFAIGTILAAVIPKDENLLDAKYLHIYLSYFKDTVIVPLMKGSANVSLTIKSLSSAEIEVPTIERQKKIVRLIDKIEKNKIKIDEKLEEQKKIVLLIKNEILNLAVKGKLVEQDENDEPAGVLLERIKEEKDRLIKEKKIKKEKELPKIAKSEIPYEIPKNWKWVRLNDIGSIIMGQSPSSETYNDNKEGIPFYQGKTDFGDLYPTPRKWCTSPKKIAIKKDVLISVRAPVGSTNICEENSCIGRGLAAIRPLCDINPFYVLYLMRSFKYKLVEKGVGSTFTAIKARDLNDFIIPLPPLNEQNKIVERINVLLKLCDELQLKIENSKLYNNKLMESILKNIK